MGGEDRVVEVAVDGLHGRRLDLRVIRTRPTIWRDRNQVRRVKIRPQLYESSPGYRTVQSF